MGARMKKMHEQRRMAKGRAVRSLRRLLPTPSTGTHTSLATAIP